VNIRKIVKALIPRRLFRAIEPFGHLCEAVLFNIINGYPAKSFKVIGVTGTNGKTTTSFMIHKMLQQAGYKVGLMTTVAWGVGDDIKPQREHMTNVPVPLLMKRLKAMKAEGVEWLVMETTSMALAQHRVFGIPYSVAVFTNLTQDHLDYHGTFERYRDAKLKLFKLVAKNKKGLQTAVVNADDPAGSYFAKAVPKTMTYGIKKGEVKAGHIISTAAGSSFDAGLLKIKTNLPGEFNIYNALATATVGLVLNLETKQIEQGIAALDSVAGRMERVDAGQNFAVLVDYAHTPDALEKALAALKQATDGKVIVVFGATGDRDKSKRPQMGEVAAKNADLIYLTDDETYTEDPETIRQAVYKGIEDVKGVGKTTIIADRRQAIKAAFTAANKGDSVLLAGIGHQDYRAMDGQKLPWEEPKVAHDLLKHKNQS
jgi:UDP-N-acetylmuramoyl-L-alanyl-D-glutamate--2,6-diaminopimelate ligase